MTDGIDDKRCVIDQGQSQSDANQQCPQQVAGQESDQGWSCDACTDCPLIVIAVLVHDE